MRPATTSTLTSAASSSPPTWDSAAAPVASNSTTIAGSVLVVNDMGLGRNASVTHWVEMGRDGHSLQSSTAHMDNETDRRSMMHAWVCMHT